MIATIAPRVETINRIVAHERTPGRRVGEIDVIADTVQVATFRFLVDADPEPFATPQGRQAHADAHNYAETLRRRSTC